MIPQLTSTRYVAEQQDPPPLRPRPGRSLVRPTPDTLHRHANHARVLNLRRSATGAV